MTTTELRKEKKRLLDKVESLLGANRCFANDDDRRAADEALDRAEAIDVQLRDMSGAVVREPASPHPCNRTRGAFHDDAPVDEMYSERDAADYRIEQIEQRREWLLGELSTLNTSGGVGLEARRRALVKACEVLGPTTAIHCQGAFYSGPGATVAIRRATPIELDDIARQLDKAADTAFEVLERDLEFERRRRDRTIQSLTEAEQAELQRMLDEANARAEYAASAEGKLDRLIKLQERSIELNEQAAHEKSR